ncbi:hypothetical protein RHGRI_005774 [Rhododendron griersonianum]|uniref:Uncharacterized protein n=1 Tax=Rhododendron griersonianum TaxID=479676 RepID=A0AAV6LEE1_9ERIC|nr:hypothetical protein RHGRI_005774 [Rhododendron griersonianum]
MLVQTGARRRLPLCVSGLCRRFGARLGCSGRFWCSGVMSGAPLRLRELVVLQAVACRSLKCQQGLHRCGPTRVRSSAGVVRQCRRAFGCGCAGVLSSFWTSAPTRLHLVLSFGIGLLSLGLLLSLSTTGS